LTSRIPFPRAGRREDTLESGGAEPGVRVRRRHDEAHAERAQQREGARVVAGRERRLDRPRVARQAECDDDAIGVELGDALVLALPGADRGAGNEDERAAVRLSRGQVRIRRPVACEELGVVLRSRGAPVVRHDRGDGDQGRQRGGEHDAGARHEAALDDR
jgi:hypothetical protein